MKIDEVKMILKPRKDKNKASYMSISLTSYLKTLQETISAKTENYCNHRRNRKSMRRQFKVLIRFVTRGP